MEIIWHGQSCFEITEDGYTVVIDPFQPGSCGTAFPDIDLEADEVLVSHDHRDHNYREGVKLRSGRTSPFTVTTLETYHDPLKGRMRGMNTVHILDTGKLRVVHLGDIGVSPTPEQIEIMKGCDVLMIPTGGFQVIEPQAAFFLTEKISPRVCIPMHFNGSARFLIVFGNVFFITGDASTVNRKRCGRTFYNNTCAAIDHTAVDSYNRAISCGIYGRIAVSAVHFSHTAGHFKASALDINAIAVAGVNRTAGHNNRSA